MQNIFERTGYRIEITDLKEIEGGVEVFVRAWRDGKQVGFGADGSVDIERMRIFKTINDFRLCEDPKEALLSVIERNLSGMKNIHPGDKIKRGKVGHTTSTFFPVAGANEPFDGTAYRVTAGTFSALRTGAGEGSSSTDNPMGLAEFRSAASSQWQIMRRSIYGFDTSSIPDTDTISSATLSFFGTSNQDNFSQSVCIDHTVPASTSSASNSDYDESGWDTVDQADRITVTAWSTSGYNAFTLNATGIGNINKTGLTWFGTRLSADMDNSEPTHPGSAGVTVEVNANSADASLTSTDPMLVVEHAAAGSPSSSISPSPSSSVSLSPSASQSPSSSISLSPSLSPSLSISLSPSASPSAGYEDYTRGDYAVLPTDDANLEVNYSAQDYLDVDVADDVRVGQTATQEFMVHQFKDFVGSATAATLIWEGQSTLAPSASTVTLQIYNQNTTTWDTVDSDNTTAADTDFVLTAAIPDLTNYKDPSNVISCRVHQEAT